MTTRSLTPFPRNRVISVQPLRGFHVLNGCLLGAVLRRQQNG